ncbi:TerD family protein [Blastococcus sp. CT_GayMR16]|uniref:TerD family protein n=1 Tax=Blastococcus sp. CT_GayMR16 TaxID=2559607 RepID=UPI00142FC3C8|nr:TerD family protein [Blastococcus sp. CT_GayMR16]
MVQAPDIICPLSGGHRLAGARVGAVRLSKGQNTTLSSADLAFFLMTTPAGGIDTSALVLGQNGKIRQESDFVFYNQPAHPSGSVRHLGADAVTGVDGIQVTCGGLDAGVDRVLITVSVDTGSIRGYSHAKLLVRDLVTGADAYEVDVAGEGDESALVLAELYRRNGAWKLRAVSQGYDSGLAGLATDYGIEIAESTTAPPSAPSSDTQQDGVPTPIQAPTDPAPPVPDPEEVALVRNLMLQYGQACQAIGQHVDEAAQVAHVVLQARQMAEVRPQHEISIAHFAKLATEKERDFSALYEAFEGARRRARAIGSQIYAAASTVKVPFDPEMVALIVLDEAGTYGFAQVGSHVMRTEFAPSPQSFLDGFRRAQQSIEDDDSTILSAAFPGYVVAEAQPASSSHGVL